MELEMQVAGNTDYPQIIPNKNQKKEIMDKILAVGWQDLILDKLVPLDIDMAIRLVEVGTTFDFVPRNYKSAANC